ncbi:hypothetical protein [Haloarcula brevis]|uniref:hypothetical protein n=1 Tax=Haloarcula brevis TaxID=3111453 RepID=UPI00300EF71B
MPRLSAAIERAATPEIRNSYDADTFFSDSFVRRHTEFESVDEFCRAGPCERDSPGGIQRLSAEDRDEFVAATTEFETWSEMKESAAVTDLVTLTNT